MNGTHSGDQQKDQFAPRHTRHYAEVPTPIHTIHPVAIASKNGDVDLDLDQSSDSFRFVPHGDLLSFLVSPEPGYQIDQVSGCDGNIEAMTSYVTGPIIKDCHVAATFTNLGECSLWEQNCPSPQGCYVVSPDGTTTCASSGGKVIGESCDFINECAPGLICAGAPGGTSCRQLCNTNGSVSCDTGDCVGIGISNIGACY